MQSLHYPKSGAAIGRASLSVVNAAIDTLSRRAAEKFLTSRESMAAGAAEVVASGEASGEAPRGLSSWDVGAGVSRESIFSESQRDEVREIYRAALIECAASVGFDPDAVPRSWVSVHRRGPFSLWLPGGRVSPSLWCAARSEASRRAARYLYRDSETGAPSVSLEELRESLNHAARHGSESSGERWRDACERRESSSFPSGEWGSVESFGAAMESSGFVSGAPWSAGHRAATMARAFDSLAMATRSRRSEVRGFVAELRAVLVDGEAFPDDWRETGKPDTIARAVRRRAASLASNGGALAWQLASEAARLNDDWNARDLERAASSSARARAARAMASAGARATLRAAIVDRFPAYAGGAVSVSVAPAASGAPLVGEGCAWRAAWGTGGAVRRSPFLSRSLSVTARLGDSARRGFSNAIPRELRVENLWSAWKPRPIPADSLACSELVRIAQRETPAGSGARTLAVWSAWRAARDPKAIKAWRRRQRRAARA